MDFFTFIIIFIGLIGLTGFLDSRGIDGSWVGVGVLIVFFIISQQSKYQSDNWKPEQATEVKNKSDKYNQQNYTYNGYCNNRSENGDCKGFDNDGDGRIEPVYVKGYYRKDGTYVRSHYRASPR
tara:strand:- start:665 stop:1036 length:372 start_codon:yes stop_codon:yes gene_type:complete